MADWTWVPCNSGDVPADALQVGVDKDGGQIFLGRAFHEGDFVPAKIIPNHCNAYVAYGGQEHAKSDYQVLRQGSCVPVWKECSNGDVPDNAFACGSRDTCSEPIYIGRAFHDGTMTPGKIHRSHGCLYIPYDGQEIRYETYEALILE